MFRAGLLGTMIFLAGLSPALGQGINTSPPKTVFDTDLDGTAIHLQSGMQCPKATGDFQRSQLSLYDKTGFDVSCNYKNARTGDDITLYLTRRDPALQQQVFDGARQAVLAHNPGAKIRDTTLPPPSSALKWLQAGYTERDGAVASDLFLAVLQGWEYEIRATYRPDAAAAVTAAISDLDTVVMKTAGAHLAACAAAPAPDRSGQAVRTQKLLTVLVLSGVLRAELSVPNANAGAVWCAQTGFAIGEHPYLDWRNIAANAVVVERLAGIDGGVPVYVVKDPAAAEIATKTDPGSALANGGYVIVTDGPDTISLMDVYAGYPPLMAAAKPLTGRQLVFAAASKADKKITVYASAVDPPH